MIIGVPKEIKELEFRVGLSPSCVKILVDDGHTVLVQSNAGDQIGFSDDLYRAAGARVEATAEAIYEAEMIVKVKEPLEEEYPLLTEGQILFCFLHLSPNPALTRALVESACIAIAYETVTNSRGSLPLLLPMSEIAGRIGIQEGAHALQMIGGGKGVLLGGAAGVLPGKVVVIGGGAAGTEAARIAMGMGADVTIVDTNLVRLKELELSYAPKLKTLYSNPVSVGESVAGADLVIGSVLIPGKRAPKIITREMVQAMEHGSVLVDIAIDQGGCAETSRPTTHTTPTFIEEGVVHYCVTNIPAACSGTSTKALNNATLSYVRRLAAEGYRVALKSDADLMNGLNVCRGFVTNANVAEDLAYDYHFPESVLA